MTEEAVLQLRHVTKQIGSRVIVDDVSFDVPRGEVFGFLGPNGAGKTTTIRMIVGLIAMTKGDIFIKGIPVRNQFEQAMTHIGAIVENPEMYKFLTGYQNLTVFARRHRGVTKQRIDEVVRLVGLQSRIHEKVKRYSLGMRQRLGVAQALLHKPSVLIFDEPTNGLDPAGIRELRDYLRNLAQQEGIAIMVSSHLLSEMELMCDRIAIIQAGKLVDVRTMQDLKQTGGVQHFVIEVAEVEKAMACLAAAAPELRLEAQGDALHVYTNRDHVPELNRQLVRADISVFGIHTAKVSLEDQFLELTRGEQVV